MTDAKRTHVHAVVEYGLARRLGVPVVVDGSDDPTWDGRVLRIGRDDDRHDLLVHELAHWLVARAHGELGRVAFGLPAITTGAESGHLEYLKGFLIACVTDTDENVAIAIAHGRREQCKYGDRPLMIQEVAQAKPRQIKKGRNRRW